MDLETLKKLKRVLKVAATAPGNWTRFLAAGLIKENTPSSVMQLSSDWQKAFEQLVPINKQAIREYPGQFLANVDDVVYRGTTSGTTSKQSFVYFAGDEWNQARIQSRRQFLQWWGIGDEISIINVASRLFPLRENDSALAGLVTDEFLDTLLDLLSERPSALRGYPTRLCEVAAYLYDQKLPPVIAVICTGECLFEYQQKLLEDVFAAPVINEYGCQETGIFGMTCPEVGRLHLDNTRCFYEIIDGQWVTTDLLNHTMPIVRYQCGDILDLSTEPCPCGRPGLTANLLGRIEEQIRTVNGMRYPNEIRMPPLDGILNYQVVRREDNQVDIRLQPVDAVHPSLTSLANWTRTTLGDVSAQIFLDESQPINNVPTPSSDDLTWINEITQGSWNTWLEHPSLPLGSALTAAQLLKNLINPGIIVGTGLPSSVKKIIINILNSPPSSDPEIEKITVRILLFDCNFIND